MENRHYFSSGEKRTTTSFRRRCPLDDAHTTTIRSIDSISTHTQTTTFRDKYTPKLPLAESTQSVVEEPCRSIYFHRDTTSGDQSKTGLDKPQHFAAPSDSHNNNAFTTVLSDDDGDANNNPFGGSTGYNSDFRNTFGIVSHSAAVGTVKLLDLATESEYQIERQGTLFVAKYAMGHGVLRPECAIELVA